MIIVNLDGGLGNQLFQYAAGKALAIKNKAGLKLDTSSYIINKRRQYSLHHFSIQEAFCTPHEKEMLKRKEYFRSKLKRVGIPVKPYWYTEKHPGYDNYLQRFTDNVYLEGFWQSERYFKPIEHIIREEFRIKEAPSGLNKQYLDQVKTVNAVSIHVRRGDYVTDAHTHSVHGVCEPEYYTTAINLITSEISDPYFFVFSDDMDWTRSNLSTGGFPAVYIDNNTQADYEDLRLMYSCKHHIIANSSFSWWGAWLNNYTDKKVIAPKRWFRTLVNNDILPGSWRSL
jgi:hypothetical protein